jgi:hypothetical protein
MSKRREALRVAGWLTLLTGLISVVGAALTNVATLDYVAAYGVLFVGAGLWVVLGLSAVTRYERRVAARHGTVATVPSRQIS